MTRRERLERKAEKRREWAESRKRKSEAAFDKARKVADAIPLGQPILVGHHSEKHARRDQERIHSGMSQGVEHSKVADHHSSKAAGIQAQLDRSIYSDDENAIQALKARIAENENLRDRLKAVNAAWRKAGKPDPAKPEEWERMAATLSDWTDRGRERLRVNFIRVREWQPNAAPVESYQLTNLGARIRSDRKRIEELERRNAKAAKAEAAGGVCIEIVGGTEGTRRWAVVTFAEKPDRDVLDRLKAAGFSWGAGSWTGPADRLPEGIA